MKLHNFLLVKNQSLYFYKISLWKQISLAIMKSIYVLERPKIAKTLLSFLFVQIAILNVVENYILFVLI